MANVDAEVDVVVPGDLAVVAMRSEQRAVAYEIRGVGTNGRLNEGRRQFSVRVEDFFDVVRSKVLYGSGEVGVAVRAPDRCIVSF